MTKKGKPSGDYEGWILRLIENVEDIEYSYNLKAWLEFAASKIEKYHGVGITKGQIAALADSRDIVFGLPKEVGYRREEYEKLSGSIKGRFRDTEGQWGRKGTWVSRDKINTAMQAEIESRGVRKKPRGG